MDERKSRILIVDDEPTDRKLLRTILLREGYDLVSATSGAEVLNRLDELNPDTIIMDVMMPEMNGLEICRRLKNDPKWQHIPIILVTSLDGKEDLVQGLDAGADDFLHKPVNNLELRARLRSMLRIKKQFDELEANLQMREDLTAMIVHDMRNPLTNILGVSELLKHGLIALDDAADIDMLYNESLRLNAFLNDTLMLAKTAQGQLILKTSYVDPHHLILEVQRSHQMIARRKHINLRVDMNAQNRRPVKLDINLFRRTLDNLVSNALKFSPRNSTVTISLEYPEPDQLEPPHLLRLKVADEGPGIPEEHRKDIFDKFKVLRLKKSGVPQVGLGLAFCKLVAEAHGGKISVQDNQPKGSVFTVEI